MLSDSLLNIQTGQCEVFHFHHRSYYIKVGTLLVFFLSLAQLKLKPKRQLRVIQDGGLQVLRV